MIGRGSLARLLIVIAVPMRPIVPGSVCVFQRDRCCLGYCTVGFQNADALWMLLANPGVVKTQDDLDAKQASHRITKPSQFVRCQQPFRQGKLRQKPPLCMARLTLEPHHFAQ